VSVCFNGQNIKDSPFDLHVRGVSAEKSSLEVKNRGPLPGASKTGLKIVAIDQDGIPLKQGGDQFTASITINGRPQVGLVFLSFFFLNNTDCFVFGDRTPRPFKTSKTEFTSSCSLQL